MNKNVINYELRVCKENYDTLQLSTSDPTLIGVLLKMNESIQTILTLLKDE